MSHPLSRVDHRRTRKETQARRMHPESLPRHGIGYTGFMFKMVHSEVWAFDMEWTPDPLAGRLLYPEAAKLERDEEVFRIMWERGGATTEDPTPFLKMAICRIVSIAAVSRQRLGPGEISLRLLSLPHDPSDSEETFEAAVLQPFLDALGDRHPQIVGYNSLASDLKILLQRATILGLEAPGFCQRPEKPWEGVDYFARGSDFNVDLKEILGGWGHAAPSLHQLAVQSGIPGKMDVDGNSVAGMWLEGRLDEIVHYNEFDALSTYLLWLRVAHLGGFFDTEGYEKEQRRVEILIEDEIGKGRSHLESYLVEWKRLQAAVEAR